MLAELAQRGLRAYPRKLALPQLGSNLKTEEKPELNDISDISRAVAARLEISDSLRANAIKAALNRIKEKEHHTELTTGDGYTEEIRVFTDRNALAREAMAALRTLPQAEEEDYRLIVQALASRLRARLVDAKPLPDVMLFPSSIALELSAKNIYGVLPPTVQDGERVAQVLLMDDRMTMAAWARRWTFTTWAAP